MYTPNTERKPEDAIKDGKLREDLFYRLAGRNVVVTGPATLMITLRLIAQIWRRENENRNAEEIADKAGKIYDQVVLVAEAMIDRWPQEADAHLRRWLAGREELLKA